MGFTSSEKLYCDVLVIGGGGAGLRAATAAAMQDADVLLVSKSGVGTGANTYLSKAVIASPGWGEESDGPAAHVADTVRGGCFMNDQALAAKMAERARSEISFLKECGVVFGMQGDRPNVIHIPGHRCARHLHGAGWTGSDLVLPLKRRAEQAGVRFAGQVFVTRLTASGGRVTGACGVTADGRFIRLSARAVVLATGGFGRIYRNTNNAPGITGDGAALAYGLGVPLKDMEFVQFYPTATGRCGSRLLLYDKLLTQPGAVLRDARGEDILARHCVSPADVTRDHLSQILTRETLRKDLPDPVVTMDLSALSEEAAARVAPVLPSGWRKGEKVFRVSPTAHFCMGGIVTDLRGKTTVNGLFAAGEATAGVHGANRLGGNALTEIFALGSWVGEAAALSSTEAAPRSPEEGFEAERARLEGMLSDTGVGLKPMAEGLKSLMWEHAGVIRTGADLEKALSSLKEPLPRIKAPGPAALIRLLTFHNMRKAAEMVCRAALVRTESRGAHFREDFPDEDNGNWLKNVILKKDGADMAVELRPVAMDFVKPEA